MDPTAFHNLAMAEIDALYRFAYYLSGRREEADDLVQETFLHALRACDRFVPAEHGLRPWLFKVLHNVLNTRLARGQRDAKLLATFGALSNAHAAPAGDAATEFVNTESSKEIWERINWENIDQRLKSSVLELPLLNRTVFLLAAVEGLKYREIAELIEVPIGTVMSRLARARSTLAGQLADLAKERNLPRQPGSGKDAPHDERTLQQQTDDKGEETIRAT